MIRLLAVFTVRFFVNTLADKKDKGTPYSIPERGVPELIPVLGN